MSVPQQIKDRIDIVQYVQQHVPDLKKAGRHYKACCPFHEEKTPSFVVNPDTQTWRCFGSCAEGGDVFNFAMKINNWDFREALKELASQTGVELKKKTPQQQQESDRIERLQGLLQTVSDYYHQHLFSEEDDDVRSALAYALDKRGFTPETLQQWDIGYAPNAWRVMLDSLTDLGYSREEILAAGVIIHNENKNSYYDRFRNRLMIPIRSERGKVVGFGARALNPDDNPKYLNSPQTPVFDKSRTLFGLDRAKKAIRDTGMVVIVEGYMDVIQAHQAGFHNVVAQMGTAMTEAQLNILVPKYANTIIMALDSDDAGQNATRRSLDVARQALQADYTGKLSVDIRILQIEDAKDPDDILRETPEKWQDAVDNAIPVAEFVINMETAELDSKSTIQERQQVAQRVLPILMASENNMYRNDNLQKLALRLRINEADLFAWAREIEQQERERQKARERYRKNQQNKTESASSSPTQSRSEGQPMLPPITDEWSGQSNEEPPPRIEYDEQNVVQNEFDEQADYGQYEGLGDALATSLPPRPKKSKSVSPPTLFQVRHASRATERYCLRMLLQQESLLFQANRTLRELAANDDILIQDVLGELSQLDFSQSDYRLIFDFFLQAMQQHELSAVEYLRLNLDEDTALELETILAEEDVQFRQQIGGRFRADSVDVMKAFNKQKNTTLDIKSDWLFRILDVRRQRLKREREELIFLTFEDVPEDQPRLHDEQLQRINQAWHRVNEAIEKQHQQLRSSRR